MQNFYKLNATSPSAQELTAFLDASFHRAGHELKIVMPLDFKRNVSLFDNLPDERLKAFAYEIHSKWKSLLRQVDKTLICSECESTALDLPFPFLVPGGRFREYYYWDTFWILEGIYVSGMCKTAKSVVENTLWMAKRYGFVPNGSRAYYLNRSQPPMLPMIVERYFEHCGAQLKKPDAFLARALEGLELEYSFWMDRRSVSLEDAQGKKHVLNRYSADMRSPRPESYLHDVKLAANMSEEAASNFYHNVAATTESGWDFSGRWMNWSRPFGEEIPSLNLSITSQIVPVDLNAVLFRNELIIANIYGRLKREKEARKYEDLAEARAEAIQAMLFSPELNLWKDYNFHTKSLTTDRPFYITDICPLWYGPYKHMNTSQVEQILTENDRIMYAYPGGIPISEIYTGQQWDFPNVWAPTQYLAVKVHLRLHAETKNPYHLEKAVSLAQKWITTTYCGHKHYGYVFEKYNAKVVGQPGGGGEYIVQEGFGWSNGVILWMIQTLGANLTIPEHCPNLPIQALFISMRDVEPSPPNVFLDVLTVAVWIMAALLCCTYLVVAVSKLRPRNEIIPTDRDREELLI